MVTYPDSKLPEGKWVFSVNQQFRHSEPLLSVVGALPRATFPDANQGPSLQSGLFRDSSQDCCVNAFLHSCEDGREAISKMETHGNSRAFKHSRTRRRLELGRVPDSKQL